MQEKKIDLILSCFYEFKIKKILLDASQFGGINIHPSALPYNGGGHTSFWGIVDQTPLGASFHWLSPELFSGKYARVSNWPTNFCLSRKP